MVDTTTCELRAYICHFSTFGAFGASPSTQDPSSSSSDNTGLIVGATVGAGLVVLLAVVLVCKRSKRGREVPTTSSQVPKLELSLRMMPTVMITEPRNRHVWNPRRWIYAFKGVASSHSDE